MSTTPEEAQGTPAPEHDFDELTGVYGFFRRHQKKLLYTAGLFTLLTFSITGSLTNIVQGIGAEERDRPTMQVNGQRVSLTSDDYRFGAELARRYRQSLPYGVMLQVSSGDSSDNDMAEVFAILRRAAITEGIEPSMAEVDRAIEAAREMAQAESVAKLAVNRGYSSLAEYRLIVAEAMRVGVFTRLQTLALNGSDAEVMRQVLLHQEKVTYKVATFDEQAHQDELKEKSELTDDDFKNWLNDQNDTQKQRMNAFDLPTVQLRFAALLWAEGQFKPAEFADGVLEGYTITDDQLKSFYDAEKEYFKKPDTDEYRAFEDEDVKDELTRMAQAERIMVDLNTKMKEAQLAAVQPMTDEVAKVQNELNEAQGVLTTAGKNKFTKESELKRKEAELEKDPENAELKTAVEALRTDTMAAVDAHSTANLDYEAKKTALEVAQKAEEDARSNFDFVGEFNKLVEGKSGFVHKAMEKQASAEDLKDLDKLGLDLGHWERSMVATSLSSVGSLGNGPGRTYKASTIYQSLAMDARPLKPWDDLKELVQDAYWTEKAVAIGKEKQQAMKDALLRLGKEKIPEFIADAEKKRQERIDTKAKEWEDGVNAAIAKAQEMLKTPNLSSKLVQNWQIQFDRKTKELESKDARVKMFEQSVEREIEIETAEEAKKHYAAILAAAATETGYTVQDIGPFTRELSARPRFADDYDKTIVYVFQNQSDMEEGDSVGPVADIAERRSHVITCTKVEPMTAEDVTRRDFERRRKFFVQWQLLKGQQQAFRKEVLEKRYDIKRPQSEVTEPE